MTRLARALVASVLLLGCSATLPSVVSAAERSAAVEIFYVDLAPYGRWVEHDIYGTIWIPANGSPDWHPYTEGRWVWTADYGWYWDSDEEFGWATYHYGRWVLTAEYGWAWVPDDVWGPAWVDWRYGDGHVGWAPMPPEHRWRNGSFASASVDLGGPAYRKYWVFVGANDFARGNTRVREPEASTEQRLAASTRVTNYKLANGRIINRSIDRERLSKDTQVQVAVARIGTAKSGNAAELSKMRGAGIVPVYRPQAAAMPGLDLNAPDIDFSKPGERFEAPPVKEATPAGSVAEPHGSVEVGAGTSFGGSAPSTRRSEPSGSGIGGGLGVGTGAGGIRLGR